MNPTSDARPVPGHDPWWTAVPFVVGREIAGVLGAWLGGQTRRSPWIDDTPRPALWPPAWVFPAVFAGVNYPSLGIATRLVWRRRRVAPVAGAIRLFVAQLVLNASFAPLVYRVKRRFFFVATDVVGLVLTAATARSYRRVDQSAGYAIAPYLAWVCFTTLIKAVWWRMERD